jgi:hypothetical protein
VWCRRIRQNAWAPGFIARLQSLLVLANEPTPVGALARVREASITRARKLSKPSFWRTSLRGRVGAFARMRGLPVSSHASQALVLANEPTPVGALARVRDASVSQPSTTPQDPRSGERAYQRAVPAFDCMVTAEGTADESHTSEFGTPQRIALEGFP